MNTPTFTIGRKFALLLAAFLALQVLQLGVGIYHVRHVSEEAGHLSEIGRLRPASLAELSRRALAPGAAAPAARQQLLDALAAQDRIYRHLAEEYRKKAGDPRYADLARSVIEANDAWEKELQPLIRSVDPARPEAGRAALARYEALFPVQAGRLGKIATLLEQELRAEIRVSVRNHVLIFVLSVLLALAAVWFVRRYVTAPLRAQAQAAHALAEGDYDRRLAVSARDEVGVLAASFNRMAAAIAERTAQLAALNQIAVAITSALRLQELLDEIMRRGVLLMGAKASCIAFYDATPGRFKEWITHGLSEHFVKNMAFRPGGLADEAFTSGSHVLSNDRPETRHKLSRLAREEGLTSFICLPLTSRDRRLGVIYFYRTDRDTFTPAEIELAGTFAALAAQAVENARLYEQTRTQAVTDDLTGVSNRHYLTLRLPKELARARRSGKPVTAVMIDIDHFKRLNDGYGHQAGDAVLRQVAGLLLAQVRDIDMVVRYGGEEFLLLLPETDHLGATPVADRVRRAVEQATVTLPDRRRIRVTISCGIACYPECAENAEEMISRADQALYAAKLAGRNRVVTYRDMAGAH